MSDSFSLTRATDTLTPLAQEHPRARLERLSSVLRRSVWLIAAVFGLTVLGAYSVISLLTEQYDTEAEILVKMGRENLDPPPVSRNVPLSAGLRHEELVSEIEILKSPDLIARVVDEIGVNRFKAVHPPAKTLIGKVKDAVKSVARAVKEQYAELLYALDLRKRLDDRQKAVSGVMDALAVEAVKDSDVISLKLRMPDPSLARDIEDRLIAAYLIRRVEVRRTPGVKEFLDQWAVERQSALKEAESRTEGVKRESGVTAPTEQASLLLKQIRDLSAGEAATSGEINSTLSQIAAAQKAVDSASEYQRTTEQQLPNPARQSIEEKLIALKLQRSQELQRYKADSGVVTATDESIARLTGLLAQENTTQVGSVTMQLNQNRISAEQTLQQGRIRLEGLRAMDVRQKTELDSLRQELSKVETADYRLNDLERNRKIAEQDYDSVMRHKFDSDLSTELDRERVSNVSVSRYPSSTLEPVYPRKLLIMAIALAAGLILGICLALLLHYLDDTVDDPRQLELESGLPCLGSLDAQTQSA